MRHRIYVHVTWTTRDRSFLIDKECAFILRRLLPAIAAQERARIVELGMVQTHVHTLVQIHPTTSIPRLMQRLKGGSSVIANRELGTTSRNPLRWAKGYNIDSVSPRAADHIRKYVRSQPTHHPEKAIKDDVSSPSSSVRHRFKRQMAEPRL